MRKILFLSEENLTSHEMSLKKRISVKINGRYRLIDISGIICYKAEGSYTLIDIEGEEKIITSKNLKFFERTLPKTRFCRCHHSCIVNIGKIRSYNKNEIEMSDGSVLPVSRRRYAELAKMLEKK